MADFAALRLKDSSPNIDRGVVAVKQRRCGNEAHRFGGAVVGLFSCFGRVVIVGHRISVVGRTQAPQRRAHAVLPVEFGIVVARSSIKVTLT